MVRREYVLLASLAALVLLPSAASAQYGRGYSEYAAMQGGGKPAISAVGTSTVQRKPTQLKMFVQLTAKGKNLEEALAKLKERREAAKTQLESLNADKKSIVFGSPSLSNFQSVRKRQIEAMVQAQLRSRGKKAPKGLVAPQTVTVSTTLTVHWPLEAETEEKLMLLAQGIQDKVKAADLAGGKEKEVEKLSPEEEELAEEAGMTLGQSGEDPQQLGQPRFAYVATLSKEDRQKAMSDAFANAKTQAADLAKAAGVEIGPLVGISGGCSGQSNFTNNIYARYDSSEEAQFMQQMIAQQTGEDPDAKQDEAMSAEPGKLKFN